MNATVITTDDLSLASDMLFHPPDSHMQNYMNQGLVNYIKDIGNVVPDFAKDLQNRYRDFLDGNSMRYVKNLKSRINGLWNTNSIKYLATIEEIQQATPIMQKWIMAHPVLRDRYLNNAISAYDGSYVNKEVTGSGSRDYDYRRVMDGITHLKDGICSYSNYIEKVNDEDILSVLEKTKILATWDIIDSHFENGDNIDPTSPWNEFL